MRTTKLLITATWLIGLTLLGPAVRPVLADRAEPRIDALIGNRELGETKVSVVVIDMQSGKTLVSRKPNRAMIPASNMKLLTTTTAIELLSPDFSFHTELALVKPDDLPVAQASQSQTKQDGLKPASSTQSKESAGYGLVIRGSGDPAFGDRKLLDHQLDMSVRDLIDKWVTAVEQTGIDHFKKLLIDDRIFDRQFVHPSWPRDQLNRWYCAQVAGLNFHDNCLDVLPIPAKERGAAPQVQLFPDAGFIKTINKARTGKDDAFWISRSRKRNTFTFHGRVRHRRRNPFSVTVHDPPMFFARLLADRLENRGIEIETVSRPEPDARPLPGKPLAVVNTALPAVLRRINRDSQNLFAESLFKRLGHEVTGRAGSFNTGAAAVRMTLRNTLGPSLAAAATIADGSGMSRNNKVTARLLARLLAHMHHSPYAGVLRKSMAYSGRTLEDKPLAAGTLDHPRPRFAKLEPGSWVFAKSGYLRSVSALSGYLVMPRPKTDKPPASSSDQPTVQPSSRSQSPYRVVAFSILCNGFVPPKTNRTMKSLQDQIVHILESKLHPKPQNPTLGG